MKGRKLFILAREDFSGDNKIPRLPKIRDQYERAPAPKELVILDGSAHAQFIFETEQGERLNAGDSAIPCTLKTVRNKAPTIWIRLAFKKPIP